MAWCYPPPSSFGSSTPPSLCKAPRCPRIASQGLGGGGHSLLAQWQAGTLHTVVPDRGVALTSTSEVIDPKLMMSIMGDGEQNRQRRRRRRFALLMAVRDSDYVKENYGGYYGVFLAAFRDNPADVWDIYRVIDGQFPRQEDISGYDGFVISGSPSDAHGDEPWVLQLCALVRHLYRTRKRLLGVCFGHQLICRALGGEVRRAKNGWDIGVTEVKVASAPPEDKEATKRTRLPCWFLEGGDLGEVPRSAHIIQVHQDEVWEVPPGAEVIARSDRTGVEMFHMDDRVLGIQGHPEYTKDILSNIIDRLVNNGVIQGAHGDKAKKRLVAGEPDRQFWLRVCRSFLRGPQPHAGPHTTTAAAERQPTPIHYVGVTV